MNVLINGENVKTNSSTLTELLLDLNYSTDTIATAINGSFIAKTDRDNTALTENCAIEIVAPMQGG